MQKIIQINLAGRLLPVEEDAYQFLKNYIYSLERQFAGDPDRDEIIRDIEDRIAELFTLRLQSGAFSIDRADVEAVVNTLGAASDLGQQSGSSSVPPVSAVPMRFESQEKERRTRRRLFRDPNDRMVGGVCSGLSYYFDVDPTFVRIVWGALAFAGIGVLAYFIAWAIIPAARTPQEIATMTDGDPLNFQNFSQNMGSEMNDLKKRGEAMSKDLKDFFGSKKR